MNHRHLTSYLALTMLVANASAGSGLVNLEFLDQYASTFRFGAGVPTSITPTPDGKAILFLRSGARSRVMDLYEFDVEKGTERTILTAEKILGGAEEQLTADELARRERMRQISRGLSSFELSRAGDKLLVPLSGRLYIVDRASGAVTELPSAGEAPLDPRLSPDGTKVACVRDGDLYVTDITSLQETRITSKTADTVTNGLAEFVAQEEMDRYRGYWFSPDGGSIAYEEADVAGLETFTIADPIDPSKSAQTWPYPRPGKKNAQVRLGVTSITSPGKTTWIEWDRAKYEYLANITWSKNSPLTLVVMNRVQTEIAVLTADPASGAITPIHVENDPAWLNLDSGCPAWLEDGSGFLWTTERDGWMALELRGRDGKLVRTLAGKADSFLGLAQFDAKTGSAFLHVAEDPTQTHVARLNVLDASAKPVRLTSDAGTHDVSIGEPASTYVISTSDLAGARRWDAFRGDGTRAGEIPYAGEQPVVKPRIELTTVGERGYHAAILRPSNFDPAKKYPVILSVYGGPHVTVVIASTWPHLIRQWLADQGFIVVLLDGRGTPRRGRDWERAIKNDLITLPLADQIEGLKALGAKYPEMDLTRAGVYGWSFGGYFSAMGAMREPGVFKAGCAGAPVCDWRDYDTCYTERYLGLPDPDPKAYDVSNVLTYCKDLTVPLMIVHGTADDNVYFMHSLRMADALFKGGKDYDFLVLPGFTHMVPDPVVNRSLYSRIAQFFLKHLGS